MLLLLAILSALPIETTSTRAVVRYTAPSEAACSMRVSPDADFGSLHADLDPAKFPGADSDGGGLRKRTWVIGHPGRFWRTQSGAVESRALRAAFRYYGEIVCDGQAERFEFQTQTVPFGNVYEEVLPPLEPGSTSIMPTVPEGKDRWWGAHPVTGAYFGFPLALAKDLGKEVGVDQVDAGFYREHGWENEDGWSLVYGNGGQDGRQLDFSLYAVRERGRELDINLYDGSAFANSPLGGASITPGPGPAATNWSRGGAGPEWWRTRYHQIRRTDGKGMLVKSVFTKDDPENPRPGPLGRVFEVISAHVETTVLVDNLSAYIEAYASARGLPHYGRPSLRHIQGSKAGDIAVVVDQLGNQDTPGVIYALDLANGTPCGDGWRSSVDGGSNCGETDNTGLVMAGWDPYRVGASRWTPIHQVEPDLSQDVPFGRLILNGQLGKLRQLEPTFQAVVQSGLPAISAETAGQTIVVTSELPTGAAPTCDLAAACGTKLDTVGVRATCNGNCNMHLGDGYTIHAAGESRVVESLNRDGSVRLNAPFSRDLNDESYTFDVAAPPWWSPGCPVSGSHFAGRGGDHPMFNRCIEPGDVAFLSPRRVGLQGDVDAERVAIIGARDNGNGTWTLTVTRHLSSTVSRTTGPYPAGSILVMAANWQFPFAGSVSCDFRNDPDCSKSALQRGCCHNATVVSDSDENKSLHLGAGGAFFQGHPEDMPLTPTWKWDAVPAFAGAKTQLGLGNSAQKHPQLTGLDPAFAENRRAADNHNLMGGVGRQSNSAITTVDGYTRIYKVNDKFYFERIGIIAFSGRRRYTTKSEPGAQLTDEDDHRYCPVIKEDDCVPDSKPGELYIASSDISQQYRYCLSTERVNDASLGIPCVQPMTPFANSVMEYWARDGVEDLGGRWARALLPQISGWTRGQTVFSHVQYVGNEGRWGTWLAPNESTGGYTYALVEFPPLQKDIPLGPLTFLPVRVETLQASGAQTAYVQFGYGCEPRHPFRCRPYTVERDCFAAGSKIDENDPFKWEGEELSGQEFVGGKATVTIPVLPDRVLFYRVIQKDGAGRTVHTGQTRIGASEKLAGGVLVEPPPPSLQRPLPRPRRLRRLPARRHP